MHILNRLKIRMKLAMLLGLSALALVVSIAIASSVMHMRMINDRVNKLTALVQATRGLAVAPET